MLFRKYFILTFIFLIFPLSVHAENSTPNTGSYTSKTVDECILEKKCVWYHFLKAIQVVDNDKAPSELINIRKWGSNIRFRRLGIDERVRSEKIDNLLKELVPYVSQQVSGNKKYNFAIIFTDNIEKELSEPFKEPFRKAFGGDMLTETYKKLAPNKRDKCFNFYIQDVDQNMQIISYFAFIQKDHENIDLCLKNALFSGFGLWPLSNDLLNENKNDRSYSKLDILLIFMLYQDHFKGAMSFEEVKQTFNRIYDPLIKFIQQKGVFDDY